MPGPALHRFFNGRVSDLSGIVYGRRMYQVMRYWDEDHADWNEIGRNFAAAWRTTPKWIVSRSLKTVGPNATLVSSDVEACIRRLKAEIDGDIDIAGPELAANLAELGLVDEYHLFSALTFSVEESSTFLGDDHHSVCLVATQSQKTLLE